MSRERRQVTRQINPTLLGQLQAGVSAMSTPVEHREELSPGASSPFASDGKDSREGRSSVGQGYERPALRMLAARNRQPRTTLSMPIHVGERARRLTMALTLLEAQDISLGATLDQALELLEAELRNRGARIPERPVTLRSGKRHA
jgi:hypothetical protein